MKYCIVALNLVAVLILGSQNGAHAFSLDSFKSMLPPAKTDSTPQNESPQQNDASSSKEASSSDVDAILSSALSKGGAKQKQVLSETERGRFVLSNTAFTAGSNDLTAKLELPQSPKFYNMKWCQASSCDYDNGYLELYVSVDNMPVAAWSAKLEGADYTGTKTFDFVVLPKTDAGIGVVEAPFNKSKLFQPENAVVYALLDLIYSGNLKNGPHKLKLKAYSKQTIPLNTAYEFEDSYFAKWPSIAETTIDFIITNEGRNTMARNSSAKKLSHATGEWIAIDKALKSSATGSAENQLIDVATKTTWKIIRNSLGAILYRQCKADVIYKSKYGYRLQKGILVKQNYTGSGYGTPYFAERIQFAHGPSLLNSTHLPVPVEKVR
ncbi:MAG: hypothetical protein OEL57_10520 [Trichlorobacter sp.]|uniref:hypothetical protein n=1 Tax=Trichlorobacter sp. TaxID=2911007 RepID=UPI0025661B4B|nr:hypothetical protein [Trichlorobacter sp.]MDK9718321.1 hypothetical protein [Trichlorobacter sp.]